MFNQFTRMRNAAVLLLVISVLLFVGTSAFSAEYANPQLLVTPADIEKHAGKWIVIDCRDPQTTVDKKTKETLKGYADGHIPGAITLGGDCSKILRDEKSRVKKTEDVEKILGDAGVSADKPVVVYADAKRVTHATVGYWILDYMGEKDVRLLNGGIEAWEAAGKKLDTKETKLPATKYKAHVMKNRIATTEEMLKIAKGQEKGVQTIDSRTPGEYAGTDVRAKRGGHIPNTTINVSHTETYDKATGKIKSMDELMKVFGKLDKNKRTIPLCQTGTRSTLTYLELKLMGFKDPANYDDSWIIWGNDESLPIEK